MIKCRNSIISAAGFRQTFGTGKSLSFVRPLKGTLIVSSFALASAHSLASASAVPALAQGYRSGNRSLSALASVSRCERLRPLPALSQCGAIKIGVRLRSSNASLRLNPKAICLGAAQSAAMSRPVALCSQSALLGSRLSCVAASVLPTAQGPNPTLEGTAGKHSLPVPRGLRPRAAPQLRRYASLYLQLSPHTNIQERTSRIEAQQTTGANPNDR